jgi:hypothetical protein
MATVRCIRTIVYEGEEQDVKAHLAGTLMSQQTVIMPGNVVPFVGPIGRGATSGACSKRFRAEDDTYYCEKHQRDGCPGLVSFQLQSETWE